MSTPTCRVRPELESFTAPQLTGISVLYYIFRHHADPVEPDCSQNSTSHLHRRLRDRLDNFHVRVRFLLALSLLAATNASVDSFAQAGATTAQQMYAFRFMVGFFESAFSPIIIFLLGSWYTKTELAKRGMLMQALTHVAIASSPRHQWQSGTSQDSLDRRPVVCCARSPDDRSSLTRYPLPQIGFLQAGVYASLDGHLGVAGWRWLYISTLMEFS